VKLPQRYNRRLRAPGHRLRQPPAVLHHVIPAIRRRKSQVQLPCRILSAIRPAHPAPPRTESVPKPSPQISVFDPRPNLKQLHAILKLPCFRSSPRQLLLRSRIPPRAPHTRRNPRWRTPPLAHQSRIRKHLINLPKILLGSCGWSSGGRRKLGPRHRFDCSGGIYPQTSEWARFPAGPLERRIRRGVLKGSRDGVRYRPSKEVDYLSWMGQIRGSLC